jgi:hypothetical protein
LYRRDRPYNDSFTQHQKPASSGVERSLKERLKKQMMQIKDPTELSS